MNNRPFDYEEYSFFQENKRNIPSVEMLVNILDCIRKGYFHYKTPITEYDLMSLVSNINDSYKDFYIKKNNGGKRQISVPNQKLREIQNCIRILLGGIFREGKSTVSCALPHVNRDIVYSLDIKDFYTSIHASRITETLINIGYQYDVAQLISLLVTKRTKEGLPVLPQGAPSSPIISELVVKKLDARLKGYAKKKGIQYSRYADDVIISCTKDCPWEKYADCIKRIIITEGFKVNNKKCRVSFHSQRQEVLGIIINKRLNVPTKYIKQLRTILHNWEIDGYIKANNRLLRFYIKDKYNLKDDIPNMEDIVAGKLSYLKMVRNPQLMESFVKEKNHFLLSLDNSHTEGDKVDPVWQKLHERYKALITRDYNIITGNNAKYYKKAIYRYGDDIGPYVMAIKAHKDSPWEIIKVLEYDGEWRNGNERDAYFMRYNEEFQDF